MLSTEIYTRVLRTYSGTVIFLTEKEHNNLLSVGNSDWFSVRGQKIKGSNIAEVLSVSEYFKQNPNKRPAESKPFPKVEMPKFSGNDKDRQIRRIEQMMRGVKKVVDVKRLTSNSNAWNLLNNMGEKLERIKSGESLTHKTKKTGEPTSINEIMSNL